MIEATKIRVGEIYLWAGKRWRVTRVFKEGRVGIENVDRPENTAVMPLAQFRMLRL